MTDRTARIALRGGMLLGILLFFPGCQYWARRQLDQCQQESSQALGRYQLEAQRATRLEAQNQSLKNQIADMEKQLASLHDGASASATVAQAAPTPSAAVPTESQSPSSNWRAVPKRSF